MNGIAGAQAESNMQQMGIQGRMQEAAQLRVHIAAIKVLAAASPWQHASVLVPHASL